MTRVDPIPELVARGGERLDAGELEHALQVLDEALAFDSKSLHALYLRAYAHRTLGNPAAANADARRIVVLTSAGTSGDDEWRARAWLLVGQTSAELDDEPAANNAYAQVDRLADDGGQVELELRARARAGRWDHQGALEDLEAAGSGTASETAEFFRRAGRLDRAIELLGTALRGDRDGDSRLRSLLARWEARAIRGDAEADRDLDEATKLRERHPYFGPHLRLRRGVRAALQMDRAMASALFADTSDVLRPYAWTWAVALGLRAATGPPPTRDAWQQGLIDWLLGRRDDEALVARALVASGPRRRARQLQEAHGTLALVAAGARDSSRELHHLYEAAARGDMGDVLDVWIHARARQLGSPVAHHSPRPVDLPVS